MTKARALKDRRLLVVIESLGVGGTESHLIRTLPPLVEQGWSVVAFCLTERGERAKQLEAAGIKVVAPRRIATDKTSMWRYPAHLTLATTKLYRLMRSWRPQIAHFYLPAPYLVGAPIAMATGVPIKVMSRRSLSDYQRNWPTVARLEPRLHAKMDAVVGNSRAVVRQLIEEGVPEAKAHLIYNGIRPETLPDRSEARRALGLDDDALIGVVVANLIPYKGHRELVRGLSHVEPNLSTPWRVLFAGRDHGLRAELEALAQARGIGHRVQFLGEYTNVPLLLAAADFGLLTSREEGFSNVILEGMSAALPMIVTDVGGNTEAVLDGETGIVVPPRDPNAIGEAVLRLAGDAALRHRLGAAARRRVEECFSIEQCVEAHARLYRDLLERSAGARMAAK